MTVDIRGARVLLTGATGGIGHALARSLHRAGAQLVITGRRVDVLEPLAAETSAEVVAADLGDPAQVQSLVGSAGDVDVLVANAALPGTGDFVAMSTERIDANLDVNLRAPIMLTHSVLPGMLARRRGQIVLIGSLSGLVASPGSAMYNATKFGLRGFAHALRQDLHGSGVGVSVVQPGFVSEAGMFMDSGMELPKGTRLVSPDRVAAGVLKAIAKNKGEVLTAPAELGLASRLGTIAPGLSARVQRMAGAADITASHQGAD
jgi:short-subunit dehydrogenase